MRAQFTFSKYLSHKGSSFLISNSLNEKSFCRCKASSVLRPNWRSLVNIRTVSSIVFELAASEFKNVIITSSLEVVAFFENFYFLFLELMRMFQIIFFCYCEVRIIFRKNYYCGDWRLVCCLVITPVCENEFKQEKTSKTKKTPNTQLLLNWRSHIWNLKFVVRVLFGAYPRRARKLIDKVKDLYFSLGCFYFKIFVFFQIEEKYKKIWKIN